MENYITAIPVEPVRLPPADQQAARALPRPLSAAPVDRLDIGSNGQLTPFDALGIVYERTLGRVERQYDPPGGEPGLQAPEAVSQSAEQAAQAIVGEVLANLQGGNAEQAASGSSEQERAAQAEEAGRIIGEGVAETRSIVESLRSRTPEVEQVLNDVQRSANAALNDFVTGVEA
jgi:hypothetical protein